MPEPLRPDTVGAPLHGEASGRAGPGRDGSAVTPTGWVGWIAFAGFMMIIEGGFQCIQGLVAIFDDGYYLVTRNGLVVDVDYRTWGAGSTSCSVC